ncbi:CGNR zinc finger domain-containing protein [Streptomyces sp. NPDC002306]
MVDLLNSRPHAATDSLDTLHADQAAHALLRPFGHPEAAAPPSPERLADIRALRATLMTIVAAPDSAAAAPGWAELTERASSVTLRHTFSAPGTGLQQVDGDPVVGGITLAVAQLVTEGTWPRIRACANERCEHVFYDTTRSRTQRWHSYEMCGNKNNVAAYRARKKTRADD